MVFANISDVSARLGRPISDALEIAQVNAWLGDVESQITARFQRQGLSFLAQVDAGSPDVSTVVRVEAQAVVRRLQNPTPGRTSRTESIDDGSVTDRWESSVDPWEITGAEWLDLLPSTRVGAFSVRPGFRPDRRHCGDW